MKGEILSDDDLSFNSYETVSPQPTHISVNKTKKTEQNSHGNDDSCIFSNLLKTPYLVN